MVLEYWLISIPNKLGIFLLVFGPLGLHWIPRFLFFIGVKVLSVPRILDFRNIG